jgi:aminoglycoside/choline kinase family phosphotransferase
MALNDLFTVVFPNYELNNLKREYVALEERYYKAVEDNTFYQKELDLYKERCKRLIKKNTSLEKKLYSKDKKK